MLTKTHKGGVCPYIRAGTSESESTIYEFFVNCYRIIILLFTLNLFQIEQSSVNCAFQFLKSKRDNVGKRLLLIRLKLAIVYSMVEKVYEKWQ